MLNVVVRRFIRHELSLIDEGREYTKTDTEKTRIVYARYGGSSLGGICVTGGDSTRTFRENVLYGAFVCKYYSIFLILSKTDK